MQNNQRDSKYPQSDSNKLQRKQSKTERDAKLRNNYKETQLQTDVTQQIQVKTDGVHRADKSSCFNEKKKHRLL